MNLSSQGVEIVGAEDGMSTTDKINIFTSVSTGLSNIAQSIWGPKPPTAPASEPLPAWVMPVAIGGVGVLALAIFAGKKKR